MAASTCHGFALLLMLDSEIYCERETHSLTTLSQYVLFNEPQLPKNNHIADTGRYEPPTSGWVLFVRRCIQAFKWMSAHDRAITVRMSFLMVPVRRLQCIPDKVIRIGVSALLHFEFR